MRHGYGARVVVSWGLLGNSREVELQAPVVVCVLREVVEGGPVLLHFFFWRKEVEFSGLLVHAHCPLAPIFPVTFGEI